MVYYPFHNNYSTSVACICGLKECRTIINDFRKIKDARGQTQYVPNSVDGSRKGNIADRDSHYVQCMVIHRKDTKEKLDEMQNTKVVKETRTTQPQKVERRVAICHFDKKLLGSLDEEFTIVPKIMDTKLATSKGLYHASGGSIYSQADSLELKGVKQVVLVPTSYNVTTIMKDLKDATVESEEDAIVQTALKEAETRNKHSSRDRSCDSQGKKKKRKGPDLEVIPSTAFFEMSSDEQLEYFEKLRADVLTFKQSSVSKVEEMDVRLGDLLNAKNIIADALKREEEITKKTKGRIDQLKRKQASTMELAEHLKALKEVAGLNRISIASKNGSVAKDASVCKQLFGFDDFDFMIDFLESAFEIQMLNQRNRRLVQAALMEGMG